MNGFDWSDPTVFVFGLAVFLVGCIIPIWIISVALRIIIRSFKKTFRTLTRK